MEIINFFQNDFFTSLNLILQNKIVKRILIASLFILIIFIVNYFIQTTIRHRIKDSSIRYKTIKLLDIAKFVIILVFATIIFSDKLSGFVVALGVAGAGIAFSLQGVIVSIVGWFAISLNSFFKPGDRIMLGGICGDVIDVGLLRTTLMECGGWVKGDLYNGRLVKISNALIFKEPVYNYNTDFPFLWDEINVPIKYSSDFKLARKIMQDSADKIIGEYSKEAKQSWKLMVRKYLIEDAVVEPTVTIVADENWVTYTIRYVTDYTKRRKTKDLLYTDILEKINETKGLIKIASTAFEITAIPSVDIKSNLTNTILEN